MKPRLKNYALECRRTDSNVGGIVVTAEKHRTIILNNQTTYEFSIDAIVIGLMKCADWDIIATLDLPIVATITLAPMPSNPLV